MPRPIEIEGPFRALADAAGSVQALANEWGIARETIYRWVRGQIVPEILTQRAVNDWATDHGCPPPFPEAKRDKRHRPRSTKPAAKRTRAA